LLDMLKLLLESLVFQRWLSDPTFLFWSLVGFVILGAVIIFITRVFVFFLPAVVITGVVWWLTESQFMAGVAFLLVCLVSLTKRK
jgi:membrane protein implicated in regulation of membrane protease activity